MSPRQNYPRLSLSDQCALLKGIVDRCVHSADAPTPAVVFDLDGTLMDNRPRTCAILREYADTIRAREPALAKVLSSTQPDDLAYLLNDSLELLGVRDTDHVAQVQTFWRDRFFADDHLRFDVELAGAVDFAKACYDAGGVIVYLTGRDLPLMGLGSFRSLRDLGFPIGVPGTELVLKPDAAMPDEAFKRLTAPRLARVGKVIAAFDNEPANCNIFIDHYPDATCVLVDTQHMPGAPPPKKGVHVVGDFRMRG
jgi:hypothetical protein